MSFETKERPENWDQIKEASRRLDWGEREKQREQSQGKKAARRFLSTTDCEDAERLDDIAFPGYN